MIIAGYEASSMSGATPITLITTLTHIMLGDERIATFQTQTDDSPKTPDDDKLIYHIADHLNSSSLDLSNTGLVLQATDYLPFGQSNTYEVTSKRIKGKKGGYTNKYKFANKQEDAESDLQYFEKRYYDNRIGRFTTEDPVYWEVGITNRAVEYFMDPQQWNSYSYVRNNPINLVDPTGENAVAPTVTSVVLGLSSLSTGGGTVIGIVLAPGAALIVTGLATTVVVSGVVYGLGSVDTKAFSQAMNPEFRGDPLERVGTLAPAVVVATSATMAVAVTGPPGGGPKRDDKKGDSKPKSKSSPNQMNNEIKTGKAPKEATNVHIGKIKGEQPHVHFKDGSALNINGTWKHGYTILTNATKSWLKANGWTLPK